MRVLVTGHSGYVGSHVVELLQNEGHRVTGCDLGLFQSCVWKPAVRADVELEKDIRLLDENDISGHDAIIHLAAISNDPMGEMDPGLTASVNADGPIRLAKLAKNIGISRFVFASSCSIYGRGGNSALDETAKFNPVSAYALSKIEAERGIRALGDATFAPSVLRFATAYGDSPMLRLDLVVNNLLASAYTTGETRVLSDGTPWRPLIHCRDMARACLAVLDAPRERMSGLAVNVGANSENYQVRDIAGRVEELIPNANVVYTGETGKDPRDYKVNFDLLHKMLPGFELEYTLARGMRELFDSFVAHKLVRADFQGGRYVRLKALQKTQHLLQTQID